MANLEQSRVSLKRFRPRLTAEDLAFLVHVLQVYEEWLSEQSTRAQYANYELRRDAWKAWRCGGLENVRKFKETKERVKLLKALYDPMTTDLIICWDLERRFRDLVRGKRPRAHVNMWLERRNLTLEDIQVLGSKVRENP